MIVLIKIDAMTDPNDKYVPYGPLFVANSLEKAGYEVKILHNMHLRNLSNDLRNFLDFVIKKDPIFVGFTVLTGPQAYYSAILSQKIKERVDVPIVWGGVHPTVVPEQCLSEDFIDIVVIGEGEEVAPELARALERGRDLSKIRGIGYKHNGQYVINEQRPPVKNLDNYQPSWHLIDVRKYLWKAWGCERGITYVSSRGCPHRCAFCYIQSTPYRKWRAHSIERVVSDIEWLKDEYDIDGVFFYDDNFFVNRKRALEIVKRIGIRWFGEPRFDYITEDLVKKVKEYNCARLCLGAESGSERVLKMIKKDITVNQIINATKLFAKYKVPVDYSFIIGFPGETWEDIRKTFELIFTLEKLYPHPDLFHPKVGIFLPFPGTPLYEEAIKEGFIPPENVAGWRVMDRYSSNFDIPWLPETHIKLLPQYHVYYKMGKGNLKRLDLRMLSFLFRLRMRRKRFGIPLELYAYLAAKRIKSTIYNRRVFQPLPKVKKDIR